MNIAVCDDMVIFSDQIKEAISEYIHDNRADDIMVYQYESGEELIAKFDTDHTFFDLIFLDNYMKRITGAKTAVYIRQYNTECKIVFVTSQPQNSEFYISKPLCILRKPVDPKEIYCILSKIKTV